MPPNEPRFLQFQDLVDQARKSIITYCPEWTDYNLSDPGITLIELFAWMISQLNYRLDRVPDRNYLKFLELLGTTPRPPRPAETELTFYLATPFPLVRAGGEPDVTVATRIPAQTGVATRRASGSDEEIIFSTEEERWMTTPRLCHLRRDLGGRDLAGQFRYNYLVPRQTKEGPVYDLEHRGFETFQTVPQEGDTFYLGFDPEQKLAGYRLQLDVRCTEAGVGVTTANPPLVWEAGTGPDQAWQRLTPAEDTTQGLTLDGYLVLALPLNLDPVTVRGVVATWLRCRLQVETPDQHPPTRSPHLREIRAAVRGITVPALHSAPVPGEIVGESSGDPGQRFRLAQAPILPLDPARGEGVEVESEQSDGSLAFKAWQEVENFSHSTRYDRHVTIDLGRGEISFGPGIRQPDGQVRQYGAVPGLGRRIRVTRYRTGGGVRGNVPAGSLRVLKKPISYVVEVSNTLPARGGEDPESLEAAKLRSQEMLHRRQRAVTADDYEYFCRDLTYVARVKCLAPDETPAGPRPGTVRLLVVPAAVQAHEEPAMFQDRDILDKKPDELLSRLIARLVVPVSLKDQLRRDLDPYRMLGVTLDINEPVYIGIKVAGSVRCRPYQTAGEVKKRIITALESLMDPGGWSFGQDLYISDIYTRLKALPEVEHVTGVKLWRCHLPLAEGISLADLSWQPVPDDVIPVPAEGLICLLDASGLTVAGSEGR